MTIKYKMLASQQFGALPLRSSVDFTSSLAYDIETALVKVLTAIIIALDIKRPSMPSFQVGLSGASENKDGLHTFATGFPFFATYSSVCIRLDGDTGEPGPSLCELPWGSLVFPFLFMLYIAPISKLVGISSAFGYADDYVFDKISPNLEENAEKISATITQS